MYTISELKKQLKITENLFFNDDAKVLYGRFDEVLNCIVLENREQLTDAGDGRYISNTDNVYNPVYYHYWNDYECDFELEFLGYALESERTYKDAQYYENVIIEILEKISRNDTSDLNDFRYSGFNYLGLDEAECKFIRSFIELKNISADTPELKEK